MNLDVSVCIHNTISVVSIIRRYWDLVFARDLVRFDCNFYLPTTNYERGSRLYSYFVNVAFQLSTSFVARFVHS